MVENGIDVVADPRSPRRRADLGGHARLTGAAAQHVRSCPSTRPPQPETKQVAEAAPSEAGGTISAIARAAAQRWPVFASSGE
jgi:hypothetical protein